jgi:four helix bundle protein
MSQYNFEKLECWINAKKTALLVYKRCDKYPSKEQFSLVSQSTRAAVSIAANIAEGSSRSSQKEFCHFLEISIGSAFELETLLAIASEQNYLSGIEKDQISDLLQLTIKQIYGLKRSINK